MKRKLIRILILALASKMYSQSVDFTHISLSVSMDTVKHQVTGKVVLTFKAERKIDSIYLNGIRLKYEQVLLNDEEVKYAFDDQGIWLLPGGLLPDSSKIMISYTCQPRKGLYFVGWQDTTQRARRQIWTQGQGIDHRHWIPHRDDQTDKIALDLKIRFNRRYQVVANGLLQSCRDIGNNRFEWHYSMDKPMSSYLIALVIGRYESRESQSADGVPLQQYYYPNRAEDYRWYYYKNEEIHNFLCTEIGVDYPWENYKQVPVRDFRHGAMENTTATIFGDFFLVDEIGFKDQNYTYVNAHELAHQWFGNLVTATGSKEHWLHEGFATYYQWLSEKNLYGTEHYDWERFKASKLVFQSSRQDTLPLGHANAGSSRFYQKGAWVLHMLSEELGRESFQKVIHQYLKKYAFGLVTTDSLQQIITGISGRDYAPFFQRWIHSAGEPVLKIESELHRQVLQLKTEVLYLPASDLPLRVPVQLTGKSGESEQMELTFDRTGSFEHRLVPGFEISHWVINPGMAILAELYETREPKDLMVVYRHSSGLLDRFQAVRSLEHTKPKLKDQFLTAVAKDPQEHFGIRTEALRQLIATGNRQSISLLQNALKSGDVSLQKEAILLVTPQHREKLRPEILSLLEAPSYELRRNAVHQAVATADPESNRWLYRRVFEDKPGIPGYQVLVPVLLYRYLIFSDDKALMRLIDFAGPSFDFTTRINAFSALAISETTEAGYLAHLFDALLDPNWQLSRVARERLLEFYRNPNTSGIVRDHLERRLHRADDFEKRRLHRTFEVN